MTLDLSGCEDRELASLALTRHQPAYRELLRRHKEPVFRLISNSIGDPVEALDLVQDTFVSAFAALSRYDGSRPFKLWISKIALNKCRDWARRRKVRSFFSFAHPLQVAEEYQSDEPDGFREAAAKGELRRTEAAINQLPFALREILVLRGIEELSQSEAALTLGISEKASETRLYRARTQLKRLLEEPMVIDGN